MASTTLPACHWPCLIEVETKFSGTFSRILEHSFRSALVAGSQSVGYLYVPSKTCFAAGVRVGGLDILVLFSKIKAFIMDSFPYYVLHWSLIVILYHQSIKCGSFNHSNAVPLCFGHRVVESTPVQTVFSFELLPVFWTRLPHRASPELLLSNCLDVSTDSGGRDGGSILIYPCKSPVYLVPLSMATSNHPWFHNPLPHTWGYLYCVQGQHNTVKLICILD